MQWDFFNEESECYSCPLVMDQIKGGWDESAAIYDGTDCRVASGGGILLAVKES